MDLNCPEPELLYRLLEGDVPAAELNFWSEHLATCSRCVELAESFHDSLDPTVCSDSYDSGIVDDSDLELLIESGIELFPAHAAAKLSRELGGGLLQANLLLVPLAQVVPLLDDP